MKKTILLAFVLLLIGSTTAFSQQYRHAVGLKLGYDFALTYKMNLSEANSIDLGVNLHPWGTFGLNVYGYYNWQWAINQVPGLSWYVGPGAHIGFFSNAFYLSINGLIGLEYKFQNIPLALSIDWGPGVGFVMAKETFRVGFAGYYGGLGVKYTF